MEPAQVMEEHLSHIDTMECKACLQEKHISAFATYRRKSGEKAYRQTCKKCKNRRERARTSPLPLFSQDDMPRKKCRYCLEWKSDSDYDGGKIVCKTCIEQKEKNEKLFAREMQRLAQRNADARFHQRHPLARKISKLAREYGLSYEEYDQMFVAQKNRCAICKDTPEEGKILYVDHCHQTGTVRGLLCQKCNTLLGMANDNISTLSNAIEYLRKYI